MELFTRAKDMEKGDVCPVLRDFTLRNARTSSETPRLLIDFLEPRVQGPNSGQNQKHREGIRKMVISVGSEAMVLKEICDETQNKRIAKLGSMLELELD